MALPTNVGYTCTHRASYTEEGKEPGANSESVSLYDATIVVADAPCIENL